MLSSGCNHALFTMWFTHILQEHMQLWMQSWVDGHFKQGFVQIVEKFLKTADDVVQLVDITAWQKSTNTHDLTVTNSHWWNSQMSYSSSVGSKKWQKRESIYIKHTASQSAQTWITQFYLQITPCLPFLRERSRDGASTECSDEHLITAHYSFIDPERMKGWVGLVVWPIVDGLPT